MLIFREMPPKRKARVQIPSTSDLSSEAETTATESDVKKRKVATKQVEETRRKRSNPRRPAPPTEPSCSFLPDDIPLGNIDVSRAYNVFSAQNFITQVEMIVCPVCDVEFPINVDKKRKMICQHMIDNHQSIFREVNHVPCGICHAPISAKNPLLHYRNEHRSEFL
ncbi:hypothetical protein WR25_26844 [Diploscapter pachys]|uniref:Uncharacterized protein n=1 Tax=Diploscapter pachys TaxID=2018661 RepID=A0A2A2KZV5_9BILA|nr:hypothetical protein WR25_26844 [Diploscapter pachys]